MFPFVCHSKNIPCNRQNKCTNCDVSLSSILGSNATGSNNAKESGNAKGSGKAPRPWWAYRGAKQSEKAGQSNAVGQPDAWGGRYVEGGYEINGQFFPLPGADWISNCLTLVPKIFLLAPKKDTKGIVMLTWGSCDSYYFTNSSLSIGLLLTLPDSSQVWPGASAHPQPGERPGSPADAGRSHARFSSGSQSRHRATRVKWHHMKWLQRFRKGFNSYYTPHLYNMGVIYRCHHPAAQWVNGATDVDWVAVL